MAESHSNIDGIYNYCDRWCERCKYTHRCLSFQREMEAGIDPMNPNVPSEKAWEYIGKCFRDALTMVGEIAEREGIDLDTMEDIAIAPLSKKADRFETESKAVYNEYLKHSRHFFEQHRSFFEEKGEESIRWVEMGLDSEAAVAAQWQRVNDQVAVIQWYMPFIFTKLYRAANGIDDMHNDHWDSPEQSDANCTARILMVAIIRSMAAWRVLLSVFPEKETAILQSLSLLAQIHRRVEAVFPQWSAASPDVKW